MESKTIILPTAYCGNIEYYHYLWKHQEVVIDGKEKFQKQTFRSRCTILSANGILNLSVPVERPNGAESIVEEVLIFNAENWRKDHLKAIESAYRRTPYYEYYIDELKSIIEKDHKQLLELNTELNQFFIEKLGLTVTTSNSNRVTALQKNDPRIMLSPKKDTGFTSKRYIQPFEERHGFIGNLSVLDLIFNEGPNSISILGESNY